LSPTRCPDRANDPGVLFCGARHQATSSFSSISDLRVSGISGRLICLQKVLDRLGIHYWLGLVGHHRPLATLLHRRNKKLIHKALKINTFSGFARPSDRNFLRKIRKLSQIPRKRRGLGQRQRQVALASSLQNSAETSSCLTLRQSGLHLPWCRWTDRLSQPF
jgi:hypothetical protein